MSIAEEGPKTRLAKALDIFVDKFRPSDPEGPDYKIYGFDRHCYYSGSSEALRLWGRQTNLHSALALMDKYEIAKPGTDLAPDNGHTRGTVVGAIVFTDGQAGDKNVDAYLPLQNDDVQVAFVGVGSRTPQSDVAVKAIKAPSQVTIDTAYTVQVEAVAKNLGQGPLTFELSRDSRVIDSKPVTIGGDGKVTAQFVVGAGRLGSHSLSVFAKTTEKEVNVANNVRSTMVHVVENAKLKVLFYSQVANFDVGKVRQALVRDKKIQLDLGFDAVVRPALSKSAQTMCGHVRLPKDRAGFYEYDVIILGPCAVDSLTDAQIDGLYSFVVDRGGGLILLPGKAEYGPVAWRSEKAKALVPVFVNGQTQMGRAARGKIKLTLEGIDCRLIAQADLKDHAEPVRAYYGNISKKPAAATLATAAGSPLICMHRVGRGWVSLVNVSKLFGWYREDLEGGLLQKLISGLTAYMGRVTNIEAGIELFAQRPDDQTNAMTFDAHVCDESFAPVDGATVLLNVAGEILHMDHVGRGRYVAKVEDFAHESVIATAQAESSGAFLGERTIAVNLPPGRSEMDDVELDSKFLRALAKRLGAKYFDSDKLDKNVAKTFEATTKVSKFARMISIWPRWPLLLVLCGLLSVAWFIRRAIGLV
jgi:hypothetical protein